MAGVCLRPERVNLSLLSDTVAGDNDSATAIQRTPVWESVLSIRRNQRFIMMPHPVDSNLTSRHWLFAVSARSSSLLRGLPERVRKWQAAEDIPAASCPCQRPWRNLRGWLTSSLLQTDGVSLYNPQSVRRQSLGSAAQFNRFYQNRIHAIPIKPLSF